MSPTQPTPPVAPPIYAASQPQILVAPLPDSATFFWGRTVQGEVFVKGLGEERGRRGVKHLSVKLHVVNRLPDYPDIDLHEFSEQVIWPSIPPSTSPSSSSTEPTFPSVHRFTITLPQDSSSSSSNLPGTLNLTEHRKGEIKWWLKVTLALTSGEVSEDIQVEGTPQDIHGGAGKGREDNETEAVLDKHGVTTRLLVEHPSPRLGSLLRLGVEFQPKARLRERTAVAALATMPDPGATLRALRRVRVELYRLVHIHGPSSSSSSEHLTLLHASGKSLRYPGPAHPPLRVLFTLPTAQLGSTVDQTWGEISMSTPYHSVSFFVRVILGFGALAEVAPEEMRDFVVEQKINIRPKAWKEPRHVVIERGMAPESGIAEEEDHGLSHEERAKDAYRRKGLDRVGGGGTYRQDGPPEFDEAGPSRHLGESSTAGGLPTFLESEAQAASGEAPLPAERVMTERLTPATDHEDSPNVVDNLGGELGTWVEYDGYETFSVAPPNVSASFGTSGSMDPPHPDDDQVNVAGGLAARLGLSGSQGGMELMEQLGLGEGTRVIDLQDDLPPGIDEPSLPALPTFTQSIRPSYAPADHTPPPPHPLTSDVSPPSFAASEAAQVGTAAQALRNVSPRSRGGQMTPPPPIEAAEAPPGYFGGTAISAGGGPPAYS